MDQYSTVTGRFSSKFPNKQSIPRKAIELNAGDTWFAYGGIILKYNGIIMNDQYQFEVTNTHGITEIHYYNIKTIGFGLSYSWKYLGQGNKEVLKLLYG